MTVVAYAWLYIVVNCDVLHFSALIIVAIAATTFKRSLTTMQFDRPYTTVCYCFIVIMCISWRGGSQKFISADVFVLLFLSFIPFSLIPFTVKRRIHLRCKLHCRRLADSHVCCIQSQEKLQISFYFCWKNSENWRRCGTSPIICDIFVRVYFVDIFKPKTHLATALVRVLCISEI